MSRALTCPFLKHATKESISNIGNTTLNRLSHLCPHMRKMSYLDQNIIFNKYMTNEEQLVKDELVSGKKVDHTVGFDYEAFFDEKLNQKAITNSYRIFKRINRSAKSFPKAESYHTKLPIDKTSVVKPTEVLVWCSNDYLGLSRHPSILQSAKKTIDDYGVGSGGTRNISGNQVLHEKLEYKLAKWYRKQSGLLFTSCYVANTTTLYTLAKMIPDCVVISDQGNHASMIEGIRNSRVPKYIYKHNDVEHLESILKQIDRSKPKIIAFESLNSMNGSIAPLKDLCDVAHMYGGITFVDEVHAVGLYGPNGSGQGEFQNALDYMDIISGTMGKAIGSMGGFIVGNRRLVDFIRSYGSGFIFTTSLPPVLISASMASIDILKSDEGRQLRKRHQEIASLLRLTLTKNGFPQFHSLSHILPIHIGNAEICKRICDYLLTNHNTYVQAINHPTVGVGTERLRIAPTPYHTPDDIRNLCESLIDAWEANKQPLLHKKCARSTCSCVFSCLSLNSQPTPITCI